MSAIDHAHRVLDWRENVAAPEDMPPEWMWPFYDEIASWFDEVRQRHSTSTPETVDAPGPWADNEYAAGRR